MALPPLPVENQTDWFARRNAYDIAVGNYAEGAFNTAEEFEGRLESVEILGGLAPGDVSDATVKNLMEQPDSLTSKQLSAAIAKSAGLVDLTQYGVSAAATAAVNTAGLVAAIAEHDGTGRTLFFPLGHIKIDAPGVSTGDLRFLGGGRYATTIEQTSWPFPVFDLQGPNGRVDHLSVHLAPGTVQVGFPEAFRGGSRRGYAVGILVQGDNCHVADVHGEGFISIANFRAWDVAANDWKAAPLNGGSTHRISMADTSYGILIEGVSGFRFSDITGSYWLQPGSNAPHLMYSSAQNGGLLTNPDMQGGNCRAVDGEYSYAFQFKGATGTMWNMQADNCVGTIHFMESTVTLDGLVSTSDQFTGTQQGAVEFGPGSDSVKITNASIDMASNARPVVFHSDSHDCLFDGVVKSKHTTTTGYTDPFDVTVHGQRNRARAEVHNTGPVPWSAGLCIWGGTDNVVERPITSGNTRSVSVRPATGASGHRITDYDLREMERTGPVAMETGDVPGLKLIPRNSPTTPDLIAWETGHTAQGSLFGLATAVPGFRWVISPDAAAFRVSSNGRITSHAAPAHALADFGVSDIRIDASVYPKFREALALRATDYHNGLFARYFVPTNEVQIFKRDAGVETVLATQPFTIVAGLRHDIAGLALGSLVRAMFEGGITLSYTLSAAEQTKFTATTHGLYANGGVGGAFADMQFSRPA